MTQKTAPETTSRAGLMRLLPVLLFCLTTSVTLAPEAKAGFIETYSLSSFTLVNSPTSILTNGSAVMQGQTLVVTGGNSGTGEPGTTQLTTTAVAAGQIAFDYAYFTLDARNEDSAGYLINGLFIPLASSSGPSGEVQFTVAQGESFGFEVTTVDNQGEPGILTISDAGSANGNSATPEPGTGPVVLLAIGVALTAVGLRSSRMETGA